MTWELYAADRVGARQCQLDPYESAEIVGRVNDVSTWQVTLPTQTEAGALFTTDSFARLEVVLDGAIWRSGPGVTPRTDRGPRRRHVAGVRCRRHGVAGSPQRPPPARQRGAPLFDHRRTTSTPARCRSVLAELANVNLGPGATAGRRVPGIDGADPGTGRARPSQCLGPLAEPPHAAAGHSPSRRRCIFDVVRPDLPRHRARRPRRRVLRGPGDAGRMVDDRRGRQGQHGRCRRPGRHGTARHDLRADPTDAGPVGTWGRAETFQDRRDTDRSSPSWSRPPPETLAAGVTPVTVVFTPLETDGPDVRPGLGAR